MRCAALLGGVQIGGNASQVAQYLAEAHERHVAIVYYRRDAADGTHTIAAEIYKFGCRVVAAQSRHHLRGMKIAGCLSGYHEVFHCVLSSVVLLADERLIVLQI